MKLNHENRRNFGAMETKVGSCDRAIESGEDWLVSSPLSSKDYFDSPCLPLQIPTCFCPPQAKKPSNNIKIKQKQTVRINNDNI